jgi:hypothetical protein
MIAVSANVLSSRNGLVRVESKCENLAMSIYRPVYPRQQTLLGAVGTAEKCQEET